MKAIILILLLAPFSAVNAQPPKKHQAPAKGTAEISKLKDEFAKATEEYKASLNKLLASYEKSLLKAEERFEQSKSLYSQGLILKQQLDESANAVIVAKERVKETQTRISLVDSEAADLLLTSPIRTVPAGPARCTLKPDQAPEVRGLRLGQSFGELERIFPSDIAVDVERKNDEIGMRTERRVPIFLRHPESLQGVRVLKVTYLDNKLVALSLDYDNTVSWQSNLHFTSAIAEQLHLPKEGWRDEDPTWLLCDGFVVKTNGARYGGTLEISRSDLADEIRRRKEAIEQKRRAEFKP